MKRKLTGVDKLLADKAAENAARDKRIAKELREIGKGLLRIVEGIRAGKYKF